MTLNSDALTTVARLTNFLGLDTPASGSATENRYIAYINSLTKIIQRYTGMTFKKTTYSNEVYTAERGQTLNLKHYPIISSEPFILERRSSQLNESDWETIDGEYYTVDYEAGIIQAMAGIFFFRGRDLYRVTYTAGYDFNNSTTFLGDTDAGDVELALFLMAQDLDQNSGSQGNVKSERIGDYQVTYGQANWNQMGINNLQAIGILDHYKDLIGEGPLTPLQSI
jgi:hypothetical protein